MLASATFCNKTFGLVVLLTTPVVDQHNAKDVIVGIVHRHPLSKLGRLSNDATHLELEVDPLGRAKDDVFSLIVLPVRPPDVCS